MLLFEAYAEHDGETLDNVKWSPPYDTLMQTGNPAKINSVRQACGDRLIETVFNESRLFVVLHVSSQKTSSLSQFSGKLG